MRRFSLLILSTLIFSAVIFLLPSLVYASNTHVFKLSNGLKLIVKEDHRAPVALFSIWYKVGSSYEHNGITGVSHVLEHMMFQGTKKYGPGELDKMIAKNGGEQNAMTSSDFTMYYQRLSADKLPISFRLEADRMQHLLLQQKRFDKEIQVVMEERRTRTDDSPQGITWERFKAAAFINNPYHHPVIGWMTDLTHMTLNDLQRWYNKWYTPNNAVIVVVGDVKPPQVLALASRYFGSIKSVNAPKLKPRTEVPALGQREIFIHKPAKLPLLLMGYNVPVLKTAHEQWQPYAIEVLASILSSGDSSRFMKHLVRGQQLAVSASANYSLYRLHNSRR